MYVTLEPCSHYGKTPPCADLIIRTGIPRVVIAAEDPFLKNHSSGVEKLREAGVDVEIGVMREEALKVNRRFFTAHTLHRPYVLLKWAQSADGFIAGDKGAPVVFSTPFTQLLMHRERAYYDAIMVGTDTILNDAPRLTCRLWPSRTPGQRPLKVSFRSDRLADAENFHEEEWVLMDKGEKLSDFLHRLYSDFHVTSLMVEGGEKTLRSFISEGVADELRIETSPAVLKSGIAAPDFSKLHKQLVSSEVYGANRIDLYC